MIMDLEEVKRTAESFNRTKIALDNEYKELINKVQKCNNDYTDFRKAIDQEGYVWGLSGWKKEVKC